MSNYFQIEASLAREVNQVLKAAVERGWQHDCSKCGSHHKLYWPYAPKGKQLWIFPRTPNSGGLANSKQMLLRVEKTYPAPVETPVEKEKKKEKTETATPKVVTVVNIDDNPTPIVEEAPKKTRGRQLIPLTEDDSRHGTIAGYQAHKNQGIPVCDACKKAMAEYQKQLKNKDPEKVKEREQLRSRNVGKCGTEDGHTRHLRQGEYPCRRCLKAHAAFNRFIEEARSTGMEVSPEDRKQMKTERFASWTQRYADQNITQDIMSKSKDALSRRGGIKIEWVNINKLAPYREFDRLGEHAVYDNPQEYINKLADDIKQNGFKDELKLDYEPESGKAILREGNHRLHAAELLGLTHVPVTVNKTKWAPNSWPSVEGLTERLKSQGFPQHGYYYPGNLAPSQLLGEENI